MLTSLYNPLNANMVALSIFILLGICIILIVLSVVLAFAYWRLLLKAGEVGAAKSLVNKNYITTLSNRSELIKNLERLVAHARKDKINLALLFIDIDDFNTINVSLGFKIGDELLRHIGKVLETCTSQYTKHLYHIGSDEFAVLLYDYGKDQEVINTLANDIIHTVAAPVTIDGYELHSSCCVGICVFPDCANDEIELLKHANSARDDAKKIGYSSFSFYTQEMSKKSVMRTLISGDLRDALQRNEFYLVYQPKVYIGTEKVQGAEALLRWHHPTLGNITPDVFIPALEDLGLIHSIGRWVIYTACKDMSKVHAAGYPDISVAINISAHQFSKGDIASVVAEAIWESGISPDRVELELTEAVVMSDTEKSALMLRVLQSMGVKIAVDDFGTGYSAMNRLIEFPIKILKIDKCFIHNLHTNPGSLAIVSTMITMGKKLGFEVVAEGVECQEELDLLRQYECDLVQGFYYSKPLSLNDFVKFVQEHNNIASVYIAPDSAENSA